MKNPLSRWRRRGSKAPLHFAVFLAGIVSLGGWAFYRQERRALVAQAAAHISAIADLKASQLATWRNDLLAALRSFQTSPLNDSLIAQFLAGRASEPEKKALRSWLSDVAKAQDCEDVELLDARGSTLLAVAPGAALKEAEHSGRETALRAMAQRRGVMSDIRISREVPFPHIDVAVSLENRSGAVIGALVYHLAADRYIAPIVQQWPGASDTAECLLVRVEGSDYLVLNDLRFKTGAALRDRHSLDDLRRPAARAARGEEVFVLGEDYRSVPVYAATRNIAGTNWHLVAKIDQEEVLAPLHHDVQIISFVVVILTLAALFALLYWIEQRDLKVLEQELDSARVNAALSKRYEALTRQANDAIFILDKRLCVIEVNERATELFAYEHGEFMGLELALLDPGEAGLFLGRLDADRGWTYVTCFIRKGGSPVPVEVSARRIVVEDNDLYLVLVRDISERVKADRERDLTVKRLNTLLEFSQIPTSLDERKIFERVLEKIVAVTGSRIGAVYQVEEDQRGLRLRVGSKEVLNAGFAADSLRSGQVVIHNDLPARRMGVAICDDSGRALYILGVGDKEAPYEGTDSSMLQIAGEAFWKTLAGRHAQQGQVESEDRYSALIESMPVPLVVFDAEAAKILLANPAAGHFFGRPSPELIGRPVKELHPEEARDKAREDFSRHARGLSNHTFDMAVLRADRTTRRADIVSFCHEFNGRRRLIAFYLDVTELRHAEDDRRRAEGQLQQVQRLETVGRLAGGVAHDFNNILTALLGNCALMKETFPPDDPRLSDLGEIEAAGLRAAGLTRQLLAFSRRQRVAPLPTDLNAVVSGLEGMMRRLIGEDIAVRLSLIERPWTVMADPGQVEQVLMNLVVNSRDAMPRGGTILIETANETLEAPLETAQGPIEPGRYLRLSVKDDGEGMDSKTREHLFEPFFTTKPQGKGTGLGLATVYGIIQQAGGTISVESSPGAGAVFSIRLPAVDAVVAPRASQAVLPAPRGCGRILVVEDEAAVRHLVERVLRREGYDVSVAADAAEALALFSGASAPFDLVLTDLVMPGMDGRALAAALRACRPDVKILLMSGYDGKDRPGGEDVDESFLQKPLQASVLISAVASALRRT